MLTGLSSNNNKSNGEPKAPLDQGQTENSKDGQGLKKLGLLGVILGDLIGCTGAGIAVGYFAITKGAPWWVLLLSTSAGLGVAFYQLYKISQKEL